MTPEAGDLAELLRALKERSGRSYGFLGKRLHTSTSTLHRYCSGAAVPTEYAPLERFARVCGATRDELVELHRCWILADAARRRESAPASAGPTAPVGAGGQEPAAPGAEEAGETPDRLPEETDPVVSGGATSGPVRADPDIAGDPARGGRGRRWAVAGAAAVGALAVPGGHLRLQVTVQGSDSRPVVLHALYVRVTSTRPAPSGNAYTMGSGCGGDLAPASFGVDLDAQAPRATAVPGHEGNITTRATDFPYKVSADDPEVLNIDARTDSHDIGWYLELSWSSGDRSGTARIDDHGRPFRTAGMRGAKSYWYDASGPGRWTPYQ
ncbi:helix-turn-helix domain-containing protein [Streptomyces sp. NPDC058964]|uniref:helix-turn-helix domain-containing protein n=1 Tax=Streptomyces sp. NPDC058964 TaxID=3346681 RepID=UPI0036AA455B